MTCTCTQRENPTIKRFINTCSQKHIKMKKNSCAIWQSHITVEVLVYYYCQRGLYSNNMGKQLRITICENIRNNYHKVEWQIGERILSIHGEREKESNCDFNCNQEKFLILQLEGFQQSLIAKIGELMISIEDFGHINDKKCWKQLFLKK